MGQPTYTSILYKVYAGHLSTASHTHDKLQGKIVPEESFVFGVSMYGNTGKFLVHAPVVEFTLTKNMEEKGTRPFIRE